MPCPRCNSEVVTKDGITELAGQRFRCSLCGRRFTRRSISAFSRRAFPDDVIALAIRWYLRYRLGVVNLQRFSESGHAERRDSARMAVPQQHTPA